MQDLLERIAKRLPDADGFAAEPHSKATDRLILQDLPARQASTGGEAVAHDVGDELRPALAPQVVRDLGAVGGGDEPADLLGAWRDAAVHLTGAEHRVRSPVLAGAAMDMAGIG